MTRYAGIAALAMSVLVWGPGAAAQETANSLTGTWRLVEYTNVRDGNVVRAFGDKPLGIFIDAASGYVSIHILHNPLPQRFDDLNLPSAQQDVLEVRSYTGYFVRMRSTSSGPWSRIVSREERSWDTSEPRKKGRSGSRAIS